ncbi:hypothetical protein BD289DRAFT_428421 [Coniella lustricola]|uniref:Uncharacterized protein n=1 Tax=Coniella lustricola TaxID=2025994 RepID=A0A2T3ADX2_9PEZI|nr:hypothetical protein BD289DRAFT_428421 [Coniella lustricola]
MQPLPKTVVLLLLLTVGLLKSLDFVPWSSWPEPAVQQAEKGHPMRRQDLQFMSGSAETCKFEVSVCSEYCLPGLP